MAFFASGAPNGVVEDPASTRKRLTQLSRLYVLGAGFLLVGWAAAGILVLSKTPYPAQGPGDVQHASSSVPANILTEGKAVDSILEDPVKGSYVPQAPGGALWVLYSFRNGGVNDVVAIDAATGLKVVDANRLINSGAWNDLGFVKQPQEWILGGLALLAVFAACAVWGSGNAARAVRAVWRPPAHRVFELVTHPALVAILMVFFVGFFYVWVVPGWTRSMRVRMAFRGALGWALFFLLLVITRGMPAGDLPSVTATLYITAAAAAAWLAGWLVLRPAGQRHMLALAGLPADADLKQLIAQRSLTSEDEPKKVRSSVASRIPRAPLANVSPTTTAQSTAPIAAPMPVLADVNVVTPDALPDFSRLGGMEGLKAQMAETIGRLLAFPAEAEELDVAFGGLILFGPAGTGKTFLSRATAGEYGLNYLPVSSGDLTSGIRGEESRKLTGVFAAARQNAPCVLFFDEFDSIARRREGGGTSAEDRTTLTTLLNQLEAVRDRRDVIVMAASNDLTAIDPAAIRPGRFDRQVRVDLPDRAARRGIFQASLAERQRVGSDIDLDLLADRSNGLTPAAITRAVRRAAEAVLDDIAGGNEARVITEADLLTALREGAGTDRPTVEDWSWDRLILDDHTKRELQEIQRLVENPELATQMGLPPLSGALLFGPPGTGKTTIAKVLAAEAHCNFYPLKGSDLVSKWVGDTERNIADAFARARDNAPSIVFLDEIDALAPSRGGGDGGGYSTSSDRSVNALLQEIDGLGSRPGVFVLAATNRPDVLDPALVRGGRLSRRISIPLPKADERLALLTQQTAKMPLGSDVDLEQLAKTTEGKSGADLEALCQQAGIEALIRPSGSSAKITMADFRAAASPDSGGS